MRSATLRRNLLLLAIAIVLVAAAILAIAAGHATVLPGTPRSSPIVTQDQPPSSPVVTTDQPPSGTIQAPSPSSAIATTDPSPSEPAALVALDSLSVLASRPNVPGYERSCKVGQACSFGPAWTDDSTAPDGHNGCGTRDDVLREQLIGAQLRAGSDCVVIAGTLHDPYTGQTVTFAKADAGAVQVDHVVPLALAWDLGAAGWSQDRRVVFANDTASELLLTAAAANQSKSDSGPADWLPPAAAYRCTYVTAFTAVLTKYQLPVVAADKEAITSVLAHC